MPVINPNSPQAKRLITLYAQIAALTAPECRCTCRVPYSCCESHHCEVAIQWAKEHWGVDLPRTNGIGIRGDILPLLGPNGCTAAPHLRPICSVHTCEINSIGHKRGDLKWTEKYFELRGKIEILEWSDELETTERST